MLDVEMVSEDTINTSKNMRPTTAAATSHQIKTGKRGI